MDIQMQTQQSVSSSETNVTEVIMFDTSLRMIIEETPTLAL